MLSILSPISSGPGGSPHIQICSPSLWPHPGYHNLASLALVCHHPIILQYFPLITARMFTEKWKSNHVTFPFLDSFLPSSFTRLRGSPWAHFHLSLQPHFFLLPYNHVLSRNIGFSSDLKCTMYSLVFAWNLENYFLHPHLHPLQRIPPSPTRNG